MSMLTRLRAARFLTDYDSSVGAVRAVASALRGNDHPALSVGLSSRALADVLASPPDRVRAAAYRLLGLTQGVPLDRVRRLRVDELDEWVARQYGPGPFPVVVIGSVNGGALHLAAALRAPLLPQTTLTSVRDLATHVDDPAGAMAALAPTVRMVAGNNPRVAVYHMHDPAQDRPMLESVAYLRLKRLALGPVYERFLIDRLAPDGVVLQVECTRDWPVTPVGERAYFQFGCPGGLSEDEYLLPTERVTSYLAQEGSPRRIWEPAEPDGRRPEAEWGFDPALAADVERLARERGLTVRRLVTREPDDASPFVADLYRWWYHRLGRPTDRLLVESYVQWDPMWVLRTGSVPFWLCFNTESDYSRLRSYLEGVDPYREIYQNLFSQGIRSPGVVSAARWEELITANAPRAGLIGVDRDAYPLDLGSTMRYREAFAQIPVRLPVPEPLDISHVDRFVGEAPPRYDVTWTAESPARVTVPA